MERISKIQKKGPQERETVQGWGSPSQIAVETTETKFRISYEAEEKAWAGLARLHKFNIIIFRGKCLVLHTDFVVTPSPLDVSISFGRKLFKAVGRQPQSDRMYVLGMALHNCGAAC